MPVELFNPKPNVFVHKGNTCQWNRPVLLKPTRYFANRVDQLAFSTKLYTSVNKDLSIDEMTFSLTFPNVISKCIDKIT